MKTILFLNWLWTPEGLLTIGCLLALVFLVWTVVAAFRNDTNMTLAEYVTTNPLNFILVIVMCLCVVIAVFKTIGVAQALEWDFKTLFESGTLGEYYQKKFGPK